MERIVEQAESDIEEDRHSINLPSSPYAQPPVSSPPAADAALNPFLSPPIESENPFDSEQSDLIAELNQLLRAHNFLAVKDLLSQYNDPTLFQCTLFTLVKDPTLFPNTKSNKSKQAPPDEPNLPFWTWLTGHSLVDLDGQDDQGETALFKASSLGISKITDRLLQAKVDPSIANHDGQTPLCAAAAAGHAVTCLKLMKQGEADPNWADSNGNTPLALAAIENRTDAVRALLSHPHIHRNPLDQFGWTPLMLASFLGHGEAVEYLLQAGADRSTKDSQGKSAIDLATENNHHRIARRLANFTPDDVPSTVSSSNKGGNRRKALHNDIKEAEWRGGSKTPDWDKTPRVKRFLEEGDVPDDISLDSEDQQEIFRKLDRRDTLDSTASFTTLSSTHTSTPSHPETLRSRCRNGATPRNGTLKARHIKDLTLAELNSREKGGSVEDDPAKPVMSNLGSKLMLGSQSHWELFSRLTTICCLPVLLNVVGRMKDRSVQQAWREKVALCLIILIISMGLGFLTFGFSSLVCQKVVPIFLDQVQQQYSAHADGVKLMIVRGQLYDTGSYFPVGNHRPILPFLDEDIQPIVDAFYGQDISKFFPPDRPSSSCRYWPTLNGMDDPCGTLGKNPKMHCHTSKDSWAALQSLSINNYVAFSWANITGATLDKYFVFNEKVYSLTSYLDPSNLDRHFGFDLDPILEGFVGRDATKDILRHPKLTALIPCFEEQLLVGRLDGTTIGCFASNLVMALATSILLTITVVKFAAAMLFDWFLSWKLGKISSKHRPRSSVAFILLLVTCYSEGESSLRTTLDSLAQSDYDDEHKLLFVIADGDVTGSGNAKSTPDLLLDMLEPYYPNGKPSPPKPRLYIAIGDGAKQVNMAKVYMGHYVLGDHRVPFLLVIKVGIPMERTMPKAGNRGKRDSQLILMRWLSNICFNEKMTPLEYDLSEKVRTLSGVTPDRFDMVLMVDADTIVLPDAVARMVSAMERDPAIMGLCGETKISNKRQSWVTMIQVYEYYISHHLGKAFESIFGGVTCLPGCFCMYRIKVPKPDGYSVPILANPDIVSNYSSNDVSTLHKKNLLLLGEDRYLTTLMLRAFPKRKMIYVPKAICKTMVPDEFSVLLSQRRRWINSTIHNLLELVLVPQLCGIFCCSMQFVIFLELLGTVVMPASLLFLIYLIVGLFLGQDVLLPLLFMAALFLLQAMLILLTTRKVSYISWMLVYILALPVWNFVLPAYSFWHFDDFSWGATRKINGPDTGHGAGPNPRAGATKVPVRRWAEWQQAAVDRRSQRERRRLLRRAAKEEEFRVTKMQRLEEKLRECWVNHHERLANLDEFRKRTQIVNNPEPTTPELSPPSASANTEHHQPPLNNMDNYDSIHDIVEEEEEEEEEAIPSQVPHFLVEPNDHYVQEEEIPQENPTPLPDTIVNPVINPDEIANDINLPPVKRPRGPRPKRTNIIVEPDPVIEEDRNSIVEEAPRPRLMVGGPRSDPQAMDMFDVEEDEFSYEDDDLVHNLSLPNSDEHSNRMLTYPRANYELLPPPSESPEVTIDRVNPGLQRVESIYLDAAEKEVDRIMSCLERGASTSSAVTNGNPNDTNTSLMVSSLKHRKNINQ